MLVGVVLTVFFACRRGEAARLGLAVEADASEGALGEGAIVANAPIAIACWRGRSSLAVLVSKQECALLADKLSTATAR